jgi:tRNA A37 N6-isopentenylltransferase MiaA
MRREVVLHNGDFLHEWLRLRNPKRAEELSSGDAYRVTRGLRFGKYWIQSEREILHERICRRVDGMLTRGFVEEAEAVGSDHSRDRAIREASNYVATERTRTHRNLPPRGPLRGIGNLLIALGDEVNCF